MLHLIDDIPAAAPSRPPDAAGRCAGYRYRGWTIDKLTTYARVVLWDQQGRIVPGRHRATYDRGRWRDYHHIDDLAEVESLCYRIRRRNEIPSELRSGFRTHDRLRSRRRSKEKHDTPLITQRYDGEEHTALASEM